MASSPRAVVEHLFEVQNDHDVDAMVECFAPDYRSETPQHPVRNFTGRDQLRENWTTIFETTPNLESEILRLTEDDETVWAEVHLGGTQTDGTDLNIRGTVIFGIPDGQIEWGRIYIDPVEQDGESWEELYDVEDDPTGAP